LRSPMDVCTRTLGKRQKGENSPVMSLLPGSHESLASRNPSVLCWKYGGECTMCYLVVPKVQKRDKKSESHAANKGVKKLISSNFAKILE
jgi:hypothetical protein